LAKESGTLPEARTQAQPAKLRVGVATLRDWGRPRPDRSRLQALLRVLDKLLSLRSAPSTNRRDGRDDHTTSRRLGARLLSRLLRTAVRIVKAWLDKLVNWDFAARQLAP
jgi:hypothetical protein